jgi:Salmonella virulence plasmid 65kDa B protein
LVREFVTPFFCVRALRLFGLCLLVIGPWKLAHAQDTTSDSVGATMGEFRVDESGSANYSIPLYTVPGTAGVQPNMSLVYSSSEGNGPVGKGFNISGQSAITRCRATFESGDFIGALASASGEYEHPIEFSQNDKFCLDGERLIQVSAGNYGDADVEYRLELDPFTKVISKGGNNSSLPGSYTGPSFFQVFRKDGSASAYGNSVDSKIERNNCGGVTGIACSVMTWAVSYTQDCHGPSLSQACHFCFGRFFDARHAIHFLNSSKDLLISRRNHRKRLRDERQNGDVFKHGAQRALGHRPSLLLRHAQAVDERLMAVYTNR